MPVMTQDDIMRKCWDDPEERDCALCRAYHKNPGGNCCFALRYEEGDPPCEECPHSEDCYRLTNRSKRLGRRVPIKSVNLSPKKKNKVVVEDESRLTTPDLEPEYLAKKEDRELTLSHTVHRAGHGALEGACELVLGTLRHRRPPP